MTDIADGPGLGLAVFDALPKPVVVVERGTTRICGASRRARELLIGESAVEGALVGQALDDFVTLSRCELKQRLRIAASGGSASLSLRVAGEFDIRQIVEVSPHQHDGVACWILLFERDHPHRAKFTALTERLSESNRRAAQLREANRKLVAAREELQSMNADLERFAYIAAHDLREPCRRQLALVDLLLDEHQVREPIREELEAITAQSRLMLRMIDGFRFMSNMAGPAVRRQTVSLPELVTLAVDNLLPSDLRDQVLIDLPETIDGYETLVRILFRNLVINALRHGGRPLDLKISAFSDRGLMTYCVSNAWNGEWDESTDLLQPFCRGSDEVEGTGLGLSIAKTVVQRHQGQIWLEPSPGAFRVFFTLDQEPT